MDAAEGCLPQTLPLAHRVPGPSLASRRAARCRDRYAARFLLPWLLLAVNGVAVWRRTDEPRLGCWDRAPGAAAKDDPVERTDELLTGAVFIEWGFVSLVRGGFIA